MTLDAENEIDQQIDSLFVPAVQKPTAAADAPAAPEIPKLELEPAATKTDANPGKDLDFSAFDTANEIDKQIDSLFVPALEMQTVGMDMILKHPGLPN